MRKLISIVHKQGIGHCADLWFLIRPQGYKTFSMLNTAEHEIYLANKWHFNIY